ncbi:MAG: DUF1292 domain-containing protein [Ruminococcaceae bacterium]|nr:DUF1292 domain-containing protein [Oscillospiraceae bacterium]
MNYHSTILVKRADGSEVECDILAAFDCETTGKSYIIYTDNELDENGNTCLYASVFDESEDGSRLLEIESEEEWQMVDELIDRMIDAAYNAEE